MKADLRGQLTVFVISVDDESENLRHCMGALAKQNCLFRIEYIHNIAPMDRAFQQMIDRCKTPYFIQVDHDMILYPDGVQRLFKGLIDSDEKTAIYCLPLWDVHLERTILGCKGYRHEIVSRYPYAAAFTCEMDQVNRMKKDGFKTAAIWKTFGRDENSVGEHGKYFTDRTIFIRYKRLMEKSRLYPWVGWVNVLPHELRARFAKDSSVLNFWALAGIIAGLTSSLSDCNQELDYRELAKMPEFDRLYHVMYPHDPYELILYMTDDCNMKCRWCRRTIAEAEPTGTVGINHLETMLRRFPAIQGVCIAGFGEPLLAYNLYKMLDFLNQNKMSVGLITNGSLLIDHMARLKNKKIGYISVSLNGLSEKQYEKNTGTRLYGQVVKGIKALMTAPFTQVHVSYVLCRDNVDDVPELLDKAAEWGVKIVDLFNLLPHADNEADDEGFWSQVLRRDDPEMVAKIEGFKNHPEAERVRNWPILIDREPPPCWCRSPFISIGVNGKGITGGCRRIYPPAAGMPYITAGEVWHSPFLLDLRAQLLGDRSLKAACQMCFGNWKAQ